MAGSTARTSLPPARMTVREFLDWTARREGRWELVDGEPVLMAPASATHGRLQATLAFLLARHLRAARAECTVATEPPIIPRIGATRNLRVPDLAVSCAPSSERYDLPDPVLVIEILSPSNHTATWANVWTYAAIPSVVDILVVSATAAQAWHLARLPDGSWPADPTGLTGAEARVRLSAIDLSLSLADIYADVRHLLG